MVSNNTIGLRNMSSKLRVACMTRGKSMGDALWRRIEKHICNEVRSMVKYEVMRVGHAMLVIKNVGSCDSEWQGWL